VKKIPSASLLFLSSIALLFMAFLQQCAREEDHVRERVIQGSSELPVIGAWFWGEKEFNPGGYTSFIDQARAHSPYNLLTTSIYHSSYYRFFPTY